MKSLIFLYDNSHLKSFINVIDNSDVFIAKNVITKNTYNDSNFFNKQDFEILAFGQIKSIKKKFLIFNLDSKNNIILTIKIYAIKMFPMRLEQMIGKIFNKNYKVNDLIEV